MSRPKPKVAGLVHLVIGTLPYEFTEAINGWTTKAGAEAEVKRLEKLADEYEKSDDEERLVVIAKETHGCESFWTQEIDILHHDGGQL